MKAYVELDTGGTASRPSEGCAEMSYTVDITKILEIIGLGKDDLLKLQNGAEDSTITTEQLRELLEEKRRKRILEEEKRRAREEEERRARERRWRETQFNNDKTVTITNMCAMPSRIIPIDIDQILNATSYEEHRIFELLYAIQHDTDSVLSLINNGETTPESAALLEHQRDKIAELKGILVLHFDALRSLMNVTRRILPDSEAYIYNTVLDAINPVADILDEKEIEVDINRLKGVRFTHNTKAMAKTIALLLGLLAQAAEDQSSIRIATGGEGTSQHLDFVCSDSHISVNDWISLRGLAEGKASEHPSLKKIDNYEETVLTLRLVLLLLARQMMRLEVFAGEDDGCVIRIAADSDV